MDRIQTRTELIEYICDHTSQNAIRRACGHAGKVQVLGGFSRIPPGTRPGFIVAVTSVHGRTWNVAVTSDDHKHIFHVWVVESIPWEYFVGNSDTMREYSIYNGDDPLQACMARDNARQAWADKFRETGKDI